MICKTVDKQCVMCTWNVSNIFSHSKSIEWIEMFYLYHDHNRTHWGTKSSRVRNPAGDSALCCKIKLGSWYDQSRFYCKFSRNYCWFWQFDSPDLQIEKTRPLRWLLSAYSDIQLRPWFWRGERWLGSLGGPKHYIYLWWETTNLNLSWIWK